MSKSIIKDRDKALLEKSDMPFCIFKYESGKNIAIIASRGFCNIFGISHEEALDFLNNDRLRYYHPSDKKDGGEAFYQFNLSGGTYEHEFKFRRSTDSKDYELMLSRGFHIYTVDGSKLFFVYYYDDPKVISEVKKEKSNFNTIEGLISIINQKYLSFAKTRDEKTGLLSMAYFYEFAKCFADEEMNENRHPIFIAFDFIGMRNFNASYGFEEGNHLLEKFGNILRSEFGDLMCSRFSADHFYAVAKEENVEKKIVDVFEQLKQIKDGKTITTRCGIYVHRNEHSVDSTVACDRAKIACDSDKNLIESTYVYFNDEMLLNLENEIYVINNLDIAIQEKWIQVYYQPIIRGVTGMISDKEALARWIDPVKGILLPNEFIPILENANILYKLDLYILDCVLDEFKERDEEHLPLIPVSINVSRCDFEACDMVTEIVRRIAESGYSPSLITIEITESVIGSNPNFLKEQIKRFHDAGIKVWMDDFGSGYSTFNNLSDYDFDLIKLDMNFIRKFKENPKVAITIKNLVHMAEDLGIDFLCEGVETEDEAQFLINTGCDKLQGYFYGKPTPFDKKGEKISDKKQELPGEASYYENISMKSLYNPSANGDEDTHISKKIGNNSGIIEYINGEYLYLRGTNGFRNYLVDHNCFEDISDKKINLTNGFDDKFINLFNKGINKTIDSKSWETINYESEEGFHTTIYVKFIAKNEITNGYAIMVIVVNSVTKNRKLHDKYDPLFPVPYAVFKVVYDEHIDEIVDTTYVFANQEYCQSISKNLNEIVGKSFLETTPNADKSWFPYCYSAAVLGKTVHGSLYSPEIKKTLSFVATPIDEPMCCSFVFMNYDKEHEATEFLATKSFTDESLININNYLTLEKNIDKAISRTLKEINKLFYPDYSFLIQDNSLNNAICVEATETTYRENLDLIRNEYLNLINSLIDMKDEDGFIILNNCKDFYAYHGTNKVEINNIVIVSITNHNDEVIGYLGMINYEINDNFRVKDIFRHISSYMSFRLNENIMVEKLKHQSEYDALTNIYNRKGFMNQVDNYFKNNISRAIYAIIDIDDFKFINDLNGHYVGDLTLQHFANLIKDFFGKSAVVGRSGGDEFQIFIPNMELKQAIPLIDKLSYTEKKIIADGKEVKYNVSIGYCEYPTQADTMIKLLTSADAALYYSKSIQGSSANYYRPEMRLSQRSQLGFGLKDIAGNMPGAMLIYEALGEEKILYVNNELVKMFECESTDEFLEFVHGSFMGMLHPDDLDYVEESIWKQINEGTGELDNDFVDYRIVTKKGNVKRVIDNGRLVDSKFYGKVFYVILLEEEPHVEFQERARNNSK